MGLTQELMILLHTEGCSRRLSVQVINPLLTADVAVTLSRHMLQPEGKIPQPIVNHEVVAWMRARSSWRLS